MTPRDVRPPAWVQRLLLRRLPPGPVGQSIVGDLHEEFTADRTTGGSMRALVRYLRNALSVGLRFRGRSRRGLTPQRSPEGPRAGLTGTFCHDVRVAARLLYRRPGLTAIAVLSLGLGIGANASIFTLVDTILLKPLPYPRAEELVGVFRIDPQVTGANPDVSRLAGLYAVPYEVQRDWIQMSSVFAAAGAYATGEGTLLESGGPTSVRASLMTSGAFAALGIAPALGRSFLPEDDQVGAPPVVILSQGLWQSQFGADSGVVGRDVVIDGTAYRVVGVMPSGFAFPNPRIRLWTSLSDNQKTSSVRNAGYLQVVARLSRGLTLEGAQREMDQVARRIGEIHPDEAEDGIGLYRLKDLTVADRGSGLLILMGAVGAVLLIACTNIAGLLLVRATERRREIAVRKALGAGASRLVLQQLYESLLLSLLGGIVGWGIARVGMVPFLTLMPRELPRIGEVRVDSSLLVTAGVFALVTGLLTGLLPALKARATPISAVIQEGGRTLAGGRSTNRTQRGLVVAQVALAFVLLAGAGLFVRSMTELLAVNPGFRADGIVVASVEAPPDHRQSERFLAFLREVKERFLALPGVVEVGAANQLPFSGGWSAPPVSVEAPSGIRNGALHVATVLPGYHATMRIPILEGRGLSPDDGPGSQPVVVISQSLARTMAPDGSALGKRVRIDLQGDSVWRTVVGVAGDVVYRLNFVPQAMFYVPVAQRPNRMENWVIRTAGNPAGVLTGIRQVAHEMNPEAAPTARVLTEAIRDSEAVVSSRFMVMLLGGLAGLAAVLAVLGVYGVLAYTVQLRAHEIGIQLALGAESGRILRTLLHRGVTMAGVGMVIGVGLSLLLGRVVQSALFGVRAWDPLTLGSVGGVLLASVLAASYVPARRAAALDAVTVLRGE
jgi:predicted permease